ncbi:hypothetical protein [Synechococcus sp. HK01-R]|uniref:hypothetical protein n=1 Tax=Synechococcus sp. HK01-R TaxID=2751171 RepID=UPI001624EE91|nr:hypothetical protein [Synechococcus sp. HK01-R]QNG27883.1 hypothetical protein H0O21_04725 [Synechococcus sp. HK01-R]
MLRRILRQLLPLNSRNNGPCHFTFDYKSSSIEEIAYALRKFGGVHIKNFYSSSELVEVFNDYLSDSFTIPDNKIVYDFDVKDYHHQRGPVIRGSVATEFTNRFGRREKLFIDSGMIDFFSPKLEGKQQIASDSIVSFTNNVLALAFSEQFSSGQHHIYIYNSVKTPRCFHRDCYVPRVKSFLTLKGVDSLEQGPYGFHPFSHRLRWLRFSILQVINFIFGSDLGGSYTDSTLTSSRQIVPFFNTCGDLLITRQDCTHGDFPCTVSFKKVVLVQNFFLR